MRGGQLLYVRLMALDALPAEHIGTLSARTNDVERPVVAGGPFGTKVVATVSSGAFVGPKITYTGFGTRNQDGTASIRTAPRFETGDERYGWLNNLFCVAIGTRTPDGLEYEIYAI
jgi:hypothetical protein